MKYQPEQAYIGLGSNQGDSLQLIHESLIRMNRLAGTRLTGASHIYRTKALTSKLVEHGLEKSPIPIQPDYYNAVCRLTTYLPALKLLDSLQSIEDYLGRIRQSAVWGLPRTIDLDILLFGDQKIHSRRLTVPHPEITHRSFVSLPLAEIEPQLVLPDGQSLQKVCQSFRVKDIKPIANISVRPDGSTHLQSPKIDRTRKTGNTVISFV